LSATGLRSLFPLMAPRHLWERLNAIDSNGYVVATIIGPPIAAVAVTIVGRPLALIVLGLGYAVAAVIVVAVPDPETSTRSTASRASARCWHSPSRRPFCSPMPG